MKKKTLCLPLALLLALSLTLCSCGSSASSAVPDKTAEAVEDSPAEESSEEEPADAPEEAVGETVDEDTADDKDAEAVKALDEAVDPIRDDIAGTIPAEGTYTLFGVRNEGLLADAEALGMISTLILEENGGSMSMNEDEMAVKEWSRAGDIITLVMEDDSSASGTFHDGIFELDLFGTGEMILYFAQESADISSYELLGAEEVIQKLEERERENAPDSKTAAVMKAIDPAAGAHLNYEVHTDYMDSNRVYDVHEKGGVYYSYRTTTVGSFSQSMITFFENGTASNLYPDEMRGIVVTETQSDYLKNNILLLDDLYKLIATRGIRSDYTEETRDLEGITYDVEVFPAESDYDTEAAFYFDSEGRLVYVAESARVVDIMEIGESFYTIHAIDDAVDEAVFDISAYTFD